jgi:hypothetical protein
MTNGEANSEEFQERVKQAMRAAIEKKSFKFYHHANGMQPFDIGDVLVDEVTIEITECEGDTTRGRFNAEVEIHGNYIDSGSDQEETAVILTEPPTIGNFTLLGGDFDFDFYTLPKDDGPPLVFPEEDE